MPFVSEDAIEKVLDALAEASPDRYQALVASFAEAQPALVGWLVSESFDILTEAERAYLLYLALVIWKAAVEVHGALPPAAEAHIGDLEEHNWALLNESQGGPFHRRLDLFFEGYLQEDLLAFVEDALTLDETETPTDEPVVTREGREVLFIGLKTAIDALLGIPPTTRG